MLQEAFVPLGPAVKWEQDLTLSKLMSHSQDLPPGLPLCAAPPPFALMQYVQMPHHLDAEPAYGVDF